MVARQSEMVTRPSFEVGKWRFESFLPIQHFLGMQMAVKQRRRRVYEYRLVKANPVTILSMIVMWGFILIPWLLGAYQIVSSAWGDATLMGAILVSIVLFVLSIVWQNVYNR